MKIEHKVAWITGASSGIGEAIARELFDKGASVILSGRDKAKLDTLKTDFDRLSPERAWVIPFDISQPLEIDKAVSAIRKTVPRLDLLINNAGVSQRSYALDTHLEVDRKLFEINFFGNIHLAKSVLPWMIENGGGHIVVMSSMAGKYGFKLRTAYSAAKHALHGFYESMRAELHDKHIHITLVCPGRINTDISKNSLTGDGATYNIMDAGQQQGVPANVCARKIVRALMRNRKEVFIGRRETLLLLIKRICPPLYYWIVNRVSPT